MAMGPRCILLTGAPETQDLSWDEGKLLADFDADFSRILRSGPKTADSSGESSFLTPTGPTSKWRSVHLDCEEYEGENRPGSVFPKTQFLSFGASRGDEEREHLDFLEYSIAAFDDLASSQLLPREAGPEDLSGLDTTLDLTTSFVTSSATDSSLSTTHDSLHSPTGPLAGVNTLSSITNLKQIPSADYITRILPQTMTINLLVGVISLAPARTVQLKKSNAQMDITELIVGDETRAGFTISFWLVPEDSQHRPADDLRETLRALRAGDVLLLQNVALSCFRGSVYGQSLSKRITRNSTLLTPMDDRAASRLQSNLRPKLERVQDWVGDFVGVARKVASFEINDERQAARTIDALPPDTQD